MNQFLFKELLVKKSQVKDQEEEKDEVKMKQMQETYYDCWDVEQINAQSHASLKIDNNSFKTLVCPLCFNFLYKCLTAVCGHSFCEKCLDEYLIIKKVSNSNVVLY